MSNETGLAPRLGEVLLQRGVVNAEQLAVALAEQQQTGRPLGEIIVELGFAPGAMVAQALATQRGGMVKTEYGYATGFTSVAQALPPCRSRTAIRKTRNRGRGRGRDGHHSA